MNTPNIESVLTLAENYVVRTTFDSSDIEAAIFTLEQAQATALNNAPIYFAEGDIEGWRLCMNHAAQFREALYRLRSISEVEAVAFDSANQPIDTYDYKDTQKKWDDLRTKHNGDLKAAAKAYHEKYFERSGGVMTSVGKVWINKASFGKMQHGAGIQPHKYSVYPHIVDVLINPENRPKPEGLNKIRTTGKYVDFIRFIKTVKADGRFFKVWLKVGVLPNDGKVSYSMIVSEKNKKPDGAVKEDAFNNASFTESKTLSWCSSDLDSIKPQYDYVVNTNLAEFEILNIDIQELSGKGANYDSVTLNPIERIKLTQELAQLFGKQKSEQNPLDKIKIAQRIVVVGNALGLGAVKQTDEAQEGAKSNDAHNDVPNDDRYKDVGYIPGSRKELASNAIADAKKSGAAVLVTDIDWDAMDDGVAEKLITKSNVMGKVDWKSLRDGGMTGGTGLFMSRMLRAIAPAPRTNKKADMQLYVKGVANVRLMLEKCLTTKDAWAVRNEIVEHLFRGVQYATNENGDSVKLPTYERTVFYSLGDSFKSWVGRGAALKTIQECAKQDREDEYKVSAGIRAIGWDWAKIDDATQKVVSGDGGTGAEKPKREKIELEAATNVERVGGKAVTIDSTEQYKDIFGLKAVQLVTCRASISVAHYAACPYVDSVSIHAVQCAKRLLHPTCCILTIDGVDLAKGVREAIGL